MLDKELVLLSILLVCILVLIVLKLMSTRLSDFFIMRKSFFSDIYKLLQKPSYLGRRKLCNIRRDIKDKKLEDKILHLSKVLDSDLITAFNNMQKNQEFYLFTHLGKHIKRVERKGFIKIIREDKKSERKRLMIEAISFLGMKDFVRACRQKLLIRTFSKYNIVKISNFDRRTK